MGKLAQSVVDLPVLQTEMWKVADAKWTVLEFVERLKEQVRRWAVDDVAQFVKDVGYGSVPVWRIVD